MDIYRTSTGRELKSFLFVPFNAICSNLKGGGRDSPKQMSSSSDGWMVSGKGGKPAAIDHNKLKSMGKVMTLTSLDSFAVIVFFTVNSKKS